MSCEKQTLVNLTHSFIKILMEANGKEVDLSFCEKKLNTPKRRLYDIINVLSGIGVIQKLNKSKVKISEIQDGSNPNLNFNSTNENTTDGNNTISDHEKEIDMLLEKCDNELNDLFNSELFHLFSFITNEDIACLNTNEEYELFSVSGPPSLSITINQNPSDPEMNSLKCKIENGDGTLNVQQYSKKDKKFTNI